MRINQLLLAALLGLTGVLIHGQEIIRVSSGEWPPYFSKELPHGGVISQVVSEAFDLQDISVEYGYFPWKRSMQYAQSGRWDGSVGWKNTPDRAKHLLFSEPVATIKPVFFHLKSHPFEWSSAIDLAGKKLGGIIGYDYGIMFTGAETFGIITVTRLTSEQQLFKNLLAGRFEAFISNLKVGNFIMNKHLSPKEASLITHHPLPIYAYPIHMTFSKKLANSERLRKTFNAGLKRLIDNGRYDQIYQELKAKQNNTNP